MYRRIAIVGGNGSGKTTLGKRLAEAMGYPHLDIEKYFFAEAEIPYQNARSRDEALSLLRADLLREETFVLSAVTCDFGAELEKLYDCVIYLQVPLEIRLKRVIQRSVDQFGARVAEGGDLYEQEQRFFQKVAASSTDRIDRWLERIPAPVILMDGTMPVADQLQILQRRMQETALCCDSKEVHTESILHR